MSPVSHYLWLTRTLFISHSRLRGCWRRDLAFVVTTEVECGCVSDLLLLVVSCADAKLGFTKSTVARLQAVSFDQFRASQVLEQPEYWMGTGEN